MFSNVLGLDKFLKAIIFFFFGIAHAKLTHSYEPEIMHILGSSGIAKYFFVYIIFLLPMIIFVVIGMQAGREGTALRARRK